GGAAREARFPHLRRVISVGETPRAETLSWRKAQAAGEGIDAAALAARADAVDPDGIAFFFYTSGTAGFPKGAMPDHPIIRNGVDGAFRMAIPPADVVMMSLPLFHAFGFTEGPLMSMVTGARQVLTETFDPAESLALVEQER